MVPQVDRLDLELIVLLQATSMTQAATRSLERTLARGPRDDLQQHAVRRSVW